MFYGVCFFFFQAEDGIRDGRVTGVQTCALPIYYRRAAGAAVVHRFGGARNARRDGARNSRGRLTARGRSKPTKNPGHGEKSWCDFHVTPLSWATPTGEPPYGERSYGRV